MKAATCNDYKQEFDFVTAFYQNDLQPNNLQTQLVTFKCDFSRKFGDSFNPTIFDIKDYLSSLEKMQRDLLCEVCTVMKLILIMPATNASSERSFSALRRVKSYLRNTMGQERLNHLMVLHVHRDITDSLDMISVANEFVADSEHRSQIFGTFVAN